MLWHHWGCYRPSPLPLWIADQVRNDGGVVPAVWFLAYAERACDTVAAFHHCVASSYLAASYSAWRIHPTLWVLAYAGMAVGNNGGNAAKIY